MNRYDEFQQYRVRMNARILGDNNPSPHSGPAGATLNTKRFFRLDSACYESGALDKKTKELLGLVASMVLRCDDCIAYHIDQCAKAGVTDEELFESFDISLLVGGSIVIPHMRRAVEFLDLTREHLKSPHVS